jgi:hypothetical protein
VQQTNKQTNKEIQNITAEKNKIGQLCSAFVNTENK